MNRSRPACLNLTAFGLSIDLRLPVLNRSNSYYGWQFSSGSTSEQGRRTCHSLWICDSGKPELIVFVCVCVYGM